MVNNKALFSSAGLAGIFLGVIVSVIGITMLPGLRIDLTEDKLYTLSDGTRNIVRNPITYTHLTLPPSDLL